MVLSAISVTCLGVPRLPTIMSIQACRFSGRVAPVCDPVATRQAPATAPPGPPADETAPPSWADIARRPQAAFTLTVNRGPDNRFDARTHLMPDSPEQRAAQGSDIGGDILTRCKKAVLGITLRLAGSQSCTISHRRIAEAH